MSKPNDLNPKIRNRVASYRKAIEISQLVLAERVGVSRQTIFDIEAGKTVPSVHLALKLALYFDVGVEALFSLKDREAVKLLMR